MLLRVKFRTNNFTSGLMLSSVKLENYQFLSKVWIIISLSLVFSRRLCWLLSSPIAQEQILCSECTLLSGTGGSVQCHFHSSFSFMMKYEDIYSVEIQVAGLNKKLTIKFQSKLTCNLLFISRTFFTCWRSRVQFFDLSIFFWIVFLQSL